MRAPATSKTFSRIFCTVTGMPCFASFATMLRGLFSLVLIDSIGFRLYKRENSLLSTSNLVVISFKAQPYFIISSIYGIVFSMSKSESTFSKKLISPSSVILILFFSIKIL